MFQKAARRTQVLGPVNSVRQAFCLYCGPQPNGPSSVSSAWPPAVRKIFQPLSIYEIMPEIRMKRRFLCSAFVTLFACQAERTAALLHLYLNTICMQSKSTAYGNYSSRPTIDSLTCRIAVKLSICSLGSESCTRRDYATWRLHSQIMITTHSYNFHHSARMLRRHLRHRCSLPVLSWRIHWPSAQAHELHLRRVCLMRVHL